MSKARSSPPMNDEVQLKNVVATGDFGVELDLRSLYEQMTDVEYEPERYGAMVKRYGTGRGSLLVRKSGKFVVTGASSMEGARAAVSNFVATLDKLGIRTAVPSLQIQNVVGLFSVHQRLNLDHVAGALGAEFEPEQFPGALLRLDEPQVTLLIFQSGKVVCTGAKTEEEIARARAMLVEMLEFAPRTLLADAEEGLK